jgi:hypothetical protein
MSARILLATTMTWPFPAQLAAAFAGAGARVEALCPPESVLTRSRHVAQSHRYQMLTPGQSLRRAIADARPDLIVPCDDLAAGLVSTARGETLPGRLEFLSRASAAGAPAVAAMNVDGTLQLEEAIGRLGLPLVLKSDHSWGGEGVVIAATRQEAHAALRKLTRRSRLRDVARALRGRGSYFLTRAAFPVVPRISAQRFVEGRPATSSIACWQGALVGAHHFDVVLSTTPNSPASVIAAVSCPQMEDAARAVAGAFNLSGLFGLDYIRDGRGHVHLLEMNPRATPSMHLVLTHDLPAALMRAAGLPARVRPPVTDRSEIALFPREWLRDPQSPWLARAHHDVPWDDPEVVRTCVRAGPAAARALLESECAVALTTKHPVFGA